MNQRTKTISLIVVGMLVALVLVSYQFKETAEQNGSAEQQAQAEEPTESNNNSFVLSRKDLELIPVKRSDKAIEWPISGRVVPKNTTQIFSEVQGKVVGSDFKLNEGVSFRQGDVLLSLDTKEFELQLEAQRSAFLNILTGMMPDLKADYADNYPNWLRYVQDYKSGQSLAQLPKTRSEGEKYFVTANQVYSTFYNIKAQEERLEKFKIVAPYSGLVTEAMADKGSLVSPGQLLGTIINNRSFELEAAANLEVVSRLNVGDQVVFHSNEIGGEWVGTVLRINDIVDAKTQNIPVYFGISGANLKAGMYLEGSLTGESFKDVFAVPSSVLTRDDKVLLLKNNVITGKPVELVEFLQDSILVRGLSNDDQVIANQFNVPVEGLKIVL